MLRCYLLALASGSSVDQVSNNFTLFNLVEQISVDASVLGQVVPIEAHVQWIVASEAREREFEIRVVRQRIDNGDEDLGDPMPFRPSANERVRFRTGAFRLPRAYGHYLLAVDWRLKGAESWTRESAIWPLSIIATIAPPESAA